VYRLPADSGVPLKYVEANTEVYCQVYSMCISWFYIVM